MWKITYHIKLYNTYVKKNIYLFKLRRNSFRARFNDSSSSFGTWLIYLLNDWTTNRRITNKISRTALTQPLFVLVRVLYCSKACRILSKQEFFRSNANFSQIQLFWSKEETSIYYQSNRNTLQRGRPYEEKLYRRQLLSTKWSQALKESSTKLRNVESET